MQAVLDDYRLAIEQLEERLRTLEHRMLTAARNPYQDTTRPPTNPEGAARVLCWFDAMSSNHLNLPTPTWAGC